MPMSIQYSSSSPMKIGTRGSPLALAQAEEVRDRLMAAHKLPQDAFDIRVINTSGDIIQDRPLSEVGGKGLFTKEIEFALLNGEIDIAVHSCKDVATVLPDGLAITTYLPREDVRDAFVSVKYSSVDDLPKGAVVGTSSIRRRAQLLAYRPDLKTVEFRGNVQTRLKKLRGGVAEATFLACAGLSRLGLSDIGVPIEIDQMMPAPAQGAIVIEQRTNETALTKFLLPLHDTDTEICVSMERAFLAELDGDCRSPIAANASVDDGKIRLRGEILRLDGSSLHSGSWDCQIDERMDIAKTAAQALKSKAGEGFLGA